MLEIRAVFVSSIGRQAQHAQNLAPFHHLLDGRGVVLPLKTTIFKSQHTCSPKPTTEPSSSRVVVVDVDCVDE